MTGTNGTEQRALSIDDGTEFGARAAHHLREDHVIWLTTVSPTGAPTPNPVWFLWDEAATVLVYSLPDADRIRHLATNPKVSLNVAGDGRGGDIIVFSGLAVARPEAPPADAVSAFLTKYRDVIPRIGLTPRAFAERYSLPLRITLTRMRGY